MGDLARAFAQVLINEMHGRGMTPGRIEPNMGEAAAPTGETDPASFGPRAIKATGGIRQPLEGAVPDAAAQGRAAVEAALAPGARSEPETLDPAFSVIDRGMEGASDEAGRKAFRDRMKSAKDAKRAGAAGEAAVAKAVEPTPKEQKAATKAWIEKMRAARAGPPPPAPSGLPSASIAPGSDMPMTPPQTPPSQWGPGEAARYASAFGPQFVEQALAGGGPMPMTPPGHPFGPQPAVGPGAEKMGPYGHWLRSLGLDAVERGLEE